MRLHLLVFGKLKTPGLRDTADYYSRIIQPWVSLEETELKPLAVPPGKSPAARKLIQEKEGEILGDKLTQRLGTRGACFLLDETGKTFPTLKWADLIRSWESESIPDVAFCVGSSLGFSEKIRSRAKGIFSLGPQTLSHELARVVLLEQLYRAWSVTRGHPYHNEG